MLRHFFRLFRSAAPSTATGPGTERRASRLAVEPLEARDVPSAVSLALSPDGVHYDLLVVSATGVLSRYTGSGFTPLVGGVLSVGAAYDPAGAEEIDVVYADGSVVAYGAPVGGVQTVLPAGFGVTSVSVGFAPDGAGFREVVLQNGDLFEQNPLGNYSLLTSGVVSASVAFDRFGSEVFDLVDPFGAVTRYNFTGAFLPQPVIASGVSADSVALTAGGTLVQAAVSYDPFTQTDTVSAAIGLNGPFVVGAVQ